ncbi:MAG: phosphoglucosamine mutase [Candidatus Omnitrophica bacterium]|nr:phosphoglucosamine mutase [Candidatus Omnitrophota bacterium]
MGKLFGTDGIRAKVGVYPLTEDMIYKIARASALYAKGQNAYKRKAVRISIAKDTRTTGDLLEERLIAGITSTGVDVVKLGILPTPCSAYLVKKLKDDLGIVISASHNDIDDNGLKFFAYNGYKLSSSAEDEIEKILFDEVEGEGANEAEAQPQGKAKEEKDAIPLYIDYLKKVVDGCDLSKYRIAVDCAFGALTSLIPHLSKELGVGLLSINDVPDGNNINKQSGSLFPNVVSEHVLKEKCDCGFAFDGDGDRLLACDEKGQILDGDFILAIIGRYLYEKGLLNRNSIATTFMSNLGLEMSVGQWGGRLVKADVGDKFVLEKMLKGKLNLGGEQSGHIILLDYSTTGDALLTALYILKIMSEEGKSLSQLARCMYKFPQILLNVEVGHKKPIEELPKLNKAISKSEAKLGSKGRIYVRYSGTEDKLRIMIEGQNQVQIKELAEDIAATAQEELQCQS